ncbi:calcium-binding protein [Brucella pseudogrignonensis]|uniref:EF-hand domain-containing protein n=1 Tax=Brucella pseudogrignonensis TaxID=419475 RepID=UPI0028B47C4E|nr:calcium-binding protein [Brucella pseudogrignonensis]MDT6938930.1 calcium-binding protein [Brucella pseudogrignonensis]
MKSKTLYVAVIASALLSTAAFAQEKATENTGKSGTDTSITQTDGTKGKRGPIDLEKFSRMDELKAADTNGDGVLSRDEIEALALKRMVSRAADRLERRLDVKGDGKITLEAIEKQRQKEFAALDRNEDGKLDRHELRTAKKHHHGPKGPHHGGKGKMEHHHPKPQQ